MNNQTKLYGPAEYIASLSLEDFRKLGVNTQERINRLKEKIEQAGKGIFELKIKAIQAFRESESFKLYLSMGKEALEQNKTIQQIIEQRKTEANTYLTNEEFEKIIELSQALDQLESM